jgi:hypothetical protein
MKNLATFIFTLFIFNLCIAQKAKVTESTETIDKIPRTGLSLLIELDDKMVERLWEKQLKNYGKVNSSKGIYSISPASIATISSQPCIVTSLVKSSGKGTIVWWAIDMGKEHVTSSGSPSAYKAAEKILNDFALQCYREDINEQIEEAEKAVSDAVKAQEKQVKEGESLLRSVDRNKQEKANLEQKLKDNAAELVKLQQDIEQNKKDQAVAAQDVEKMKKALEAVKAKLAQVGK